MMCLIPQRINLETPEASYSKQGDCMCPNDGCVFRNTWLIQEMSAFRTAS